MLLRGNAGICRIEGFAKCTHYSCWLESAKALVLGNRGVSSEWPSFLDGRGPLLFRAWCGFILVAKKRSRPPTLPPLEARLDGLLAFPILVRNTIYRNQGRHLSTTTGLLAGAYSDFQLELRFRRHCPFV